MTLADLLEKTSVNPELKVRIINDDGTDIITFNAAGYSAVNEELNAREVEKIIFADDTKLIKVYLKALPPEPDPEPEPTPDPEPEPGTDPEPTTGD